MKSDYNHWFVSKDKTATAILCKREKLIDHLADVFGKAMASSLFSQFRRATFSESCRFELALLED